MKSSTEQASYVIWRNSIFKRNVGSYDSICHYADSLDQTV